MKSAGEASLQWFDAHCHFDFEVYEGRREGDWAQASAAGVAGVMIPGVSRALTEALMKRPSQGWNQHCLAGLHPYWCHEHHSSDLDFLEQALKQLKSAAVGEAGLDVHLAKSGQVAMETQWQWLQPQVELAEHLRLPLVLHVRGMHDELWSFLRRRSFSYGGLVHAFSGSEQQGRRWHELGFALGVGGAMTHPRAQRLRRTLTALPSEALLLETDSPDMLPAFLGGRVNVPAMIPLYGAILARLRNMDSLSEIAQIQQQNLYRIFPLLAVNSSENSSFNSLKD